MGAKMRRQVDDHWMDTSGCEGSGQGIKAIGSQEVSGSVH